MSSPVVAFRRIGYRKLIPWLLGQPRRIVPSRTQQNLGQPFSVLLCGLPADLLLAARRRSQLCRGTSPSLVGVLPPHRLTMRQSVSIRAGAPLSLCWPLHSRDSFCSSSNRTTGIKMSSSSSTSSSTSNGQGKPKPKSPLHKRGSLQSTTSPGESGCEGIPQIE